MFSDWLLIRGKSIIKEMDMMSWINKMDKTFLPTKESISFFSIRILITKIVELKESIIDSIIISNKLKIKIS